MNDILMTIGAERGDLILDIISEIKPKTMVELGAYIGYSAIKFDQAVRDLGGERYLSLEPNQEYAAIARSMIEFAGLSGFVHVIVGSSSSSLVNLAFAEPTLRIDLLFIDHSGRLYKEDLTLAERSSLLSPHAVVIADNIVDPNASNYVAKMDVRAPDRGSEQAVDKDPQGGERLVYDSRTLSFTLQSGESVGRDRSVSYPWLTFCRML